MGKKGKGRCDTITNGGDTEMSSPYRRRERTLLDYIHPLEHKKASGREDALLAIIRILNHGDDYDTLQEYFATCFYRVLGCIKKGPDKEKNLGSEALGLIAMTLSETDNAQEIFKETDYAVRDALNTKRMESCTFISLLKCLAIVTFFCSSNSVETQAAMQIIWKFIFPKSKQNVPTDEVSMITSPAIYAWLFLITKVNRWEIAYNHWQGAISHFLALLKDDTVCVAAAEALALIFECDNIDKFFSETEILNNIIEGVKSYSSRKKHIKGIILEQIEKVSARASVLEYFRDDKCPQTEERIYGQKLTLSSWSSMIQLKFLKDFLGEEQFSQHMQENSLFQNLFKFTPIKEKDYIPCLYESTMEKVETNIYLPAEQDPEMHTRKQGKQQRQMRQLIIDKSKTKMLNKQRKFAEERKGRMCSIEGEM